MGIRKDSVGFTVLLGALGALPPLSIDMNLPALTLIGKSLGSTEQAAAMTLSLFMAGFALAPLIYGPMSDRFGRRPLLLVGCILFALAGVGCALAPTIEFLLFCRLWQGIGAGAGAVLILAIVRDLFEGNEARARLSYVNIVRSLAPMIAPTFGALILKIAAWRAIFSVLASGGILLLAIVAFGFDESARIQKSTFTLKSVALDYLNVLTNRVSCGYSIVNALMFGGLFTYVSNCSLLYINVFHMSRELFGILFAFTASGIMLGAFINGKLSERNVSHHKPLVAGLVTASIATCIGFALNSLHLVSTTVLVLVFFACTLSMGLVAPNAAHGCMQPLPRIAGVAAAVLASIQMITGSIASALVSFMYDGRSAFAMTSVMMGFVVTSLLSYLLLVRPAELLAGKGTE